MVRNQYYVDPAIGADSGTGTTGDPFGDLQYALNTITRDDTNGDQINIRSGADEVLSDSLSFATYGLPPVDTGVIIAGYNSTANDGGVGVIDCNGNIGITGTLRARFHNLEVKNSGANVLVNAAIASYHNCFFWGSTANAAVRINNGSLMRSRIELPSTHFGQAVVAVNNCNIIGNYVRSASTSTNLGIFGGSVDQIVGNIVVLAENLDASVFGVSVVQGVAAKNTIVGSIGNGIRCTGTQLAASVADNLIVGAANGIILTTGASGISISGNACFGETTLIIAVDTQPWWEATESLGSDPLARSGADDFANRLSYYQPLNVGSVLTGGLNGGTKGAVEGAVTSGTAGFTGLRGVNRRLGT